MVLSGIILYKFKECLGGVMSTDMQPASDQQLDDNPPSIFCFPLVSRNEATSSLAAGLGLDLGVARCGKRLFFRSYRERYESWQKSSWS